MPSTQRIYKERQKASERRKQQTVTQAKDIGLRNK